MRSLVQPLQMFRGVNLNRDARVLIPGQLALAKNAFPVIPGILGKRGGMAAKQIAFFGSGPRRVFVTSWAVAPSITGHLFVAHIHVGSGSSSVQYLIAADFDKITASSITDYVVYNLGPGQTDYEPVRFVNYRNEVTAIVPGQEGFFQLCSLNGNPYVWVRNTFAPDPTIFTYPDGGDAGSDPDPATQSVPVKPRNATQYKQRMVWGNFGPGMGNWLTFADPATSIVWNRAGGAPDAAFSLQGIIGPDALAYNGRHVEVGSLEGEDITAMQEISIGAVGSAIDSVLMLLTERSCVYISGEIAYSDVVDPVDMFEGPSGPYKEHRVNYDAGCVGQDTLVKTPYGWIWVGPDDVWLLRGNYPERIGTNIRPALQACPTAGRKYWSAAYANGVFVLSLVTTTTTASDLNGTVTVPVHEYWYLDLRDGPPSDANEAKWYGPMVNQLDVDQNVVFGKVLSIKDLDGRELVVAPGQVLDTAQSNRRDCCIYDILGDSEKDELQVKFDTALEWQPDTAYRPGDIVRPRYGRSAIAARRGFMHVCVTAYKQLAFEFQTTNFTVGQVVTGTSTLATGVIAAITDNGTTGILFLSDVTMGFAGGGFQVGESLSDPLGGDGNVASPGLIDGLSSASDPTWATTSGGATSDNALIWNEVRGANELLGVRLDYGRSIGHFTADIRAADRLLSDNTLEKLIRRLDVTASATNKMQLTATALLDQGNAPKSLGSVTFGGESLQGGVDTLPAVIGGLKSRAKAFRPDESELVQCRTAQIKITDETSYVIDETNNYLVVCLIPFNRSMAVLQQFEIPQGEYADMDTLIAAICAAWNSSAARTIYDTLSLALGGVGGSTWAADSAYDDVWPYFTHITPTFSNIAGFNTTIVMGNGDEDVLFYTGVAPTGTTAGVAHLGRSKKLCAMLGFDTTQSTINGSAVTSVDDSIPSEPDLTYVFSFGERFDGAQIVHKYNSKRFELSGAVLSVQPKGAVPFKNKNRS